MTFNEIIQENDFRTKMQKQNILLPDCHDTNSHKYLNTTLTYK